MNNYIGNLKNGLTEHAIRFATANNLSFDSSYKSAILFNNLTDNFYPKCWMEIIKNPEWLKRTKKPHTQVTSFFELQSSNSSDALLMNIFCHPGVNKWSSIAKLFKQKAINPPIFGYNPFLTISGKLEPRPTEIDMVLNDEIFCEAKLTEKNFSFDLKMKIERYDKFDAVFEKTLLDQTKTEYANYQLIRNILAADKKKKRFALLCDMRRPDLVKAFYKTIICIKDVNLRNNCEIIFWQDIACCIGNDLRSYLNSKYGIS
jgi:hypothetical protein